MSRLLVKKGIGLVLAGILSIMIVLTGCGSGSNSTNSNVSSNSNGKVTLSVAVLAEDLDYWKQTSQSDSFKKLLPNVTLDLQSFKDVESLYKSLMVRQSADEMPDLFYVKPYNVIDLKDSLYVWDKSDPLVQMNKAVDQLNELKAGDGKYYGLPMKEFGEWLFYSKSIFSELGLTVPETWDQFVSTAKAIQDSGKYQGLALGGKDTWPQYPFVGFLSTAMFNDPNTDNEAAKTNTPFSPDGNYYKAFEKVEQLYKSGAVGESPLGIGYPEAEQMFASKKAGMMAIGQYYYADFLTMGGDLKDLGLFPLPIVNDPNETNRQVYDIDLPFCISKDSKHIDIAKKVIEWYFSPEIYKPYLEERAMSSTIKGIDPQNIFTNASSQFNAQSFFPKSGDESYVKLTKETKWDSTVVGAQMLAGKDFRPIFEDLNKKWTAARQKFGMK
jgi:raffinose/stachyose/melibiose transport system substrate-binding protein